MRDLGLPQKCGLTDSPHLHIIQLCYIYYSVSSWEVSLPFYRHKCYMYCSMTWRWKTLESEIACPVAATARILGARWTLQIIHNLRQRRRFCELQELVGGVNPTTLSQRLKFLETQGLIRRFPISDAPLHVEYELTAEGRDLLPILDALARWAEKWLLPQPAERFAP